ncbi:MAG: hypothetical protein MUE40_06060 [Anaerolineae bacterium]|nr:hypothetical protein [Anaerolineae bacterium]
METGGPRRELESIIRAWEGRDRQRRLLLWLPGALMLALLAGAALLLLYRLVGVPAGPGVPGVAAAMLLAGTARLLWALRRRPLLTAVRDYDRRFGLQERLSTALELLAGRIHTTEEFAAQQLADALHRARAIDVRTAIRLEQRPRAWGGALLGAALFALAAVLAFNAPPADTLSAATRDALAAAAAALRDITETVATDTSLTPEERQSLLETLETRLETLTDEPLSTDEAFAGLSAVEQALRDQAAGQRQTARTQQEAFEAAAQALNAAGFSADEASAGAAGTSSLEEAMQALLPALNSPEAAAQSGLLESLAQSLGQSSPATAQALQEAAASLQQGDTAAAQQALQEALNAAQQAQNAAQSQLQSADALQQAAQQAQNAAQNLAQSEQQQSGSEGQQSGSEGQQSGSEGQQSGSEGQQSGSEGQQSGSEGQQSGSEGQQSGSEGQQSGSEGQQSGSEGQQSGSEGQQSGSEGQQSGSEGQQSGSEGQQSGSEGQQSGENGDASSQGQGQGQGANATGAGSQPAAAGNASVNSGGAGDQAAGASETIGATGAASQSNNPDGTGEVPYEAIYAPQGLTTDGSSDIILEPDAGNVPVTEGNFQENPVGQARVPYNQVFRAYADAASRTLSGEYIPLSLRDVIQDYFTGLEPAAP